MVRPKRTGGEEIPPEVEEIEDIAEDIEYLEEPADTGDSKPVNLAEEPLFTSLLRRAIAKLWAGDSVMADFVEHVASPVSEHLGTVAAKGGEFVKNRVEDGQTMEDRYRYDQSFRGHLVNGMLPVLNIARILGQWQAPRLALFDERARRIFIAGYILHDWLKFKEVQVRLAASGLSFDTVHITKDLALVESLFTGLGQELGLAEFLAPAGGLEQVVQDLVYVAANTQVRWGTALNLSALPRLTLDGRTRDLCTTLSRLADLIAYVARTPRELASQQTIRTEIASLSNSDARLVYHHLADNRGILTNIIQNAAMTGLSGPLRVPVLYAPSGVVYLEHKDAPPVPATAEIIERTIERVRNIAGERLKNSLTGFRRDGKGLKRADYYNLFFDLPAQIRLAATAAFRNITPTKAVAAGKRFTKMRDGAWMDSKVDLDLPEDSRVDQLAEWCFYAEGATAAGATLDVPDFLLKELGLVGLRDDFLAVPRDNRAGGVGYHWYFAAGHYLKRHPGKDPAQWEELVHGLAAKLADALATAAAPARAAGPDRWKPLREYIGAVFSTGPSHAASGADRSLFMQELSRYENAKRTGRGRTAVCSLCSSPFDVVKQQEAAVLFAPQVYSNKLILHGANAIRDICPICGLEVMLRQILMNQSAASGGRFEGRNVRYLYFYPTYFFSPETLEVFRDIQNRLSGIKFTDLRKQLTPANGKENGDRLRLDAATLQRLEPLLLAQEDLSRADRDRFLRIRFPETDAVTFFFLGIPPSGKDAKDAESWVLPALLALLLPVCVDVKVVASSSPLPLLNEADEMAETVFFDGAHPFVRAVVGESRINIDQILGKLKRLLVTYFVNMDANSRMARGRWDYGWSSIPPLARDLAGDTAYVCAYLKKWQRKNNTDSIPSGKAADYLEYVRCLEEGGATMSHAGALVDLSREFYRAKRYNSNSILRPVAVVARAILDADPRLFPDRQGLVEAAEGVLGTFMERVRDGNADGRLPRRRDGETPQEAAQRRSQAVHEFARYFVQTIYFDTLRGDTSALRGKQLNLLKNAYEVLYMAAEARERGSRAEAGEEALEASVEE